MAYTPHWRFSFGGTFNATVGGANEIWECTINGRDNDPLIPLNPDNWMASVGVPLGNWWIAAVNKNSNKAALTYLKMNKIGADGHYVDPTHPHTLNVGPLNGGAAPTYPAFLSTCYSWRTSRVRGPGANGRIYPPNVWNASTAGADTLTTEERDAAAATAKALLVLLRAAYGPNQFIPCVASRVDASLLDITSVRVGSVFDVQRRRKNQIPEVYSTLSVP